MILQRRRDAGQTMAEYIAVIGVIAAILIVVLASPGPGQYIGQGIKYAICLVTNAGDASSCESQADVALKPESCIVSTESKTYGGGVEIAIVNIGKDVSFVVTKDSTGKVKVTAIDNTSLGVGTGVGVGVHGKGANFGADASLDGGIKVGIGDTWEFDNEEQANEFIGDIKEQATIDSVKSTGLGGWVAGEIYDRVAGPDVPDSHIERTEVTLEGSAGVTAGLSLGNRSSNKGNNRDQRGDKRVDPNLNAYVKVNGEEKVVIEKDKRDGSTAMTFSLGGGISGGANYVVDGKSGRAKTEGAMRIKADKNGRITEVKFTQTQIVNGEATVTTTTLPIETAEERQAVQDYIIGNGGTNIGLDTLQLTWDDMAPTQDPGPDASPIQRMLYEKGRSQRVTYEYDESDNTYGASVKLGLKLGINGGVSGKSMKVKDAEYLGAPTGDGTRSYKEFKECHS